MKIVFTYGVFDLFHAGHVKLLEKCKSYGDRLIVGLYTDKVAEDFKRPPVMDYADRRDVLQACAFVDNVWMLDDKDPTDALRYLEPDVLARGDDWDVILGEEYMKFHDKPTIAIPYHEGISTSEIIKKIKDEY